MINPYQTIKAHYLRENLERTRQTYAQEINRLTKTIAAQDAAAASAAAYRARIYNKIIKTLEDELTRRGLSLSMAETADWPEYPAPVNLKEVI